MEKTVTEGLAPRVKVYVHTDNRLLREALLRLFQKRPGIAALGEARGTGSTVERIRNTDCDVLVINSPTATLALNLVADLSASASTTKVILFGMDENHDSFLRAVCLGIRGYVLNDASSAELIDAVERVAQGQAICPPGLCKVLFDFVARGTRSVPDITRHPNRSKLTYRQHELLALVAQGLTNKEIAATLNLSEFTVKNHVYRIMKELSADTRRKAVDALRASGVIHVN